MKRCYLKLQLKQKRLLLNLMLWLIASCSSGVYANEKAVLEEIIVTARKTEENLQEVPISVTAFNSADIEARGLADLEDIALNVPNVNFSRTNGMAVISIRGFADDDPTPTSDPLVGVYIDGVYIARMQGALLEMVDAERVEVLKGPQGTLFGKNTVGGAISIISKKPRGEGDGYVKVTAGEDERVNFQGSYDFGITDDLSLIVSGLYKTRDCLLRRVNDNACVDDEDVKLVRAHANYQAGEDVSASLILDATWDHSHSQVQGNNHVVPGDLFVGLFYGLDQAADPTLPPFNPVGTGEPYVAEGDTPTTDFIRSLGASLQLEWGVSDNLTVRTISAYRDHDSTAYVEFDAFRETVFQHEPFVTLSETFSQELILEGVAFDDRLSWLAGMYYFYEDAHQESNLALANSFAAGGFSVVVDSKADSISGFGHISYDLTDRIRVSGGIRYTSETREFDTRGDLLIAPGGAGFSPPVNGKDTFTAWTPKVTLDYKPTDNILLYASVSRGFRSGGFNGQTTQANPEFFTYGPEYALNYELGFKSRLWGGRVIFNTSAYFVDYTDKQFAFQTPDPNGVVIAVRENAGEAEVLGMETELKIALTDKLRLEGAFAYNDNEYTELNQSLQNITRITLDSPFLYAPKYTATAGLQYTEPDFVGIGKASFRVDAAHKSRIYYNANIDDLNHPVFGSRFNIQEAYTKINARITFAPQNSNWTLAFYGRNLTDKVIFERNLSIPAVAAFDLAAYGQPRELGVEVQYDF